MDKVVCDLQASLLSGHSEGTDLKIAKPMTQDERLRLLGKGNVVSEAH